MRARDVVVAAVAVVTALLAGALPASAAPVAVRPVPAVDLVRYQGSWVQLAAIPQPFQGQCARDDRADYTVLPDGLVRVVNSCTRTDGGVTTIEGRARPEAAGTTSRLEVTFARTAEGWDFTNPGTYWVIGLDRDYRWAVVGAPDRASGFVLSRTARPSAQAIAGITAALVKNGYDLCDFRITAQSGGAPSPFDLC